MVSDGMARCRPENGRANMQGNRGQETNGITSKGAKLQPVDIS